MAFRNAFGAAKEREGGQTLTAAEYTLCGSSAAHRNTWVQSEAHEKGARVVPRPSPYLQDFGPTKIVRPIHARVWLAEWRPSATGILPPRSGHHAGDVHAMDLVSLAQAVPAHHSAVNGKDSALPRLRPHSSAAASYNCRLG